MEENPSRDKRRDGSHEGCSSRRRNCRWPVEDVSGDLIECSGKHCRSCTGGLIADCVALCCCPCAVVSFFALAFFKAPWMMGRRCLGLGKKKKEKKRKCEGEIDGNSRNVGVEVEISEIGIGFEDGEEKEGNLSARFEAERVWLELYQLGHLGFGRVSFSGIPSQGFDDMDSVYASPDKRMNRRDKIRGLHLLEYFVNRCHELGVSCEAWLKKGDPKEVICHEVNRVQPDFLVVGSRGLGPFQKVFVGTVSEFCAKHVDCPVITIKRKANEAPQDPVDD